VNFVPSDLVSISPAPDPSTHNDPSVNSVYGSCGVSITDASGEASSGFSTRKSARIWPFTDVRGHPFLVFTSWDLGYRKVGEATDQALGLLKRPMKVTLFDALLQGFEEWQRFLHRFRDESVQAS
nr:hypothetical protein [Tanacetum cinerariifolium]